jgi:hypothetical protein
MLNGIFRASRSVLTFCPFNCSYKRWMGTLNAEQCCCTAAECVVCLPAACFPPVGSLLFASHQFAACFPPVGSLQFAVVTDRCMRLFTLRMCVLL